VYQIVNNRNGNRTQNFLYDSLNRISQAYTNGPNWGETFTIDAWGNLTNKGSVSGTTLSEGLNAAPASVKNQLNGYCHDAAGNLVLNAPCPTGTLFPTYTYDAENRLVATAGMTYVYDGDGKRVIKCAGTYPTCSSGMAYWRGWTNQVSAETDLAGNLVENYIFFGGQRIARRDANGTIHYYFSDHLGTHSLITDVNGTMPPQSESDFYPYGGEITVTSGDTNRYKFTGKERDGESGLDHFGARYYSSATGRFTTVDPINMKLNRVLDPQRLALYSHARNAPNVWTDTDGKDLKLATGQSPTDANQVIGLLATQYQTESGRRAINAADKSAIHNTVGNVSIPDRNPPVVTYGQNVTKPNDLGNPPDPNKVDPSKTTNAIQLDINKMAAHGADMDAKTKHELSHTEDINTDLKGFVKDYLTSKSAGTEMASERKAEAAEDAPNEPATMDYQSAEYNVRAILGEPTDAPIDSTVQGAPREEDSEGGKQQ
jgi:RHS repeat-associated protein